MKLVFEADYVVETLVEGRPAFHAGSHGEYHPAIPDLPSFRYLKFVGFVDPNCTKWDTAIFEEQCWVNNLDPQDPSYSRKFAEGGLKYTRSTRRFTMPTSEIKSIRRINA